MKLILKNGKHIMREIVINSDFSIHKEVSVDHIVVWDNKAWTWDGDEENENLTFIPVESQLYIKR